MKKTLGKGFHARRRALGAMSMEYLMLLGCIVIPLALMAPSIYHMIALYSHRVVNVIALPFG